MLKTNLLFSYLWQHVCSEYLSTGRTSYASLALSYSNFSLKSPTPSDGVSIGSASSDSAHPITSQSSISSGDSDGSHHPDRRVIKVTLLTPGSDDVNYKSMIVSWGCCFEKLVTLPSWQLAVAPCFHNCLFLVIRLFYYKW